MTFKYRHRKAIILSIIIIILVGGVATFFILGHKTYQKKEIVLEKKKVTETVKKKEETKKKEEEKEIEQEEVKEMIQVDIKGAVITPGLYSLEKNSRVIDVINAAGGLREDADTSVINLSKKINDEMVIIIYTKDQVQDFMKTKEIEKQVQEKCNQVDENALKNDACINQIEQSNNKISINSATLEELMKLKGIGEAKAKDIIAYRETNGPFQSIEDLKKIPGIGDSIIASIKEDITL